MWLLWLLIGVGVLNLIVLAFGAIVGKRRGRW